MKKFTVGFSVIELLVTISVIAILLGITIYGIDNAQAKARDAQRQSDLRLVQNALELYKNKHGRYPAGCNGAANWSGQTGTSYACSTAAHGDTYIIGHDSTDPNQVFAFAPAFIPSLPTDPGTVSGTEGYVYTTNADGTVYKFMVKNTVEADQIDYNHPFKSCDRTNDVAMVAATPDPTLRRSCPVNNASGQTGHPATQVGAYYIGCDIGVCDRLYTTSNTFNRTYANAIRGGGAGGQSAMFHCDDGNAQFEASYAIWGGIAEPLTSFYGYTGTNQTTLDMLLDMSRERESEKILCLLQ